MINYYFRTVKDETLKEVTEIRTGIWVDAVDPTKDEIEKLIKDFSLDADIIEDAQDFFEVPRIERSYGAAYLFTRYPFTEQKEGSDTAPLLIVMGESFVLTLSLREVPAFKKIINGTVPVVTTQKAKLFIQMMELITKSYDIELMRIRKAVHKDRARLRKIGPSEIERLVSYETKLNNMVDALVPTNAWLQLVPKGNYMQLFNDDIEMMEDLMIDTSQVVETSRSVLKTIQNVRGSIEAIMSSRLNKNLSNLTVLTILMTVPMVIASVYGMNIDLPFQHSRFAFAGIILVIVLILFLLSFVLSKKEWF